MAWHQHKGHQRMGLHCAQNCVSTLCEGPLVIYMGLPGYGAEFHPDGAQTNMPCACAQMHACRVQLVRFPRWVASSSVCGKAQEGVPGLPGEVQRDTRQRGLHACFFLQGGWRKLYKSKVDWPSMD